MKDSVRQTTTVGDLMTVDLVSVTPRFPVSRARELMLTRGIHALPVFEGTEVVGIVTGTDLLDDWPDDEPVVSVMTPAPTLLDEGATLAEAADLLISHRIHHLLITDESGVIGVLSSLDLLSALVT